MEQLIAIVTTRSLLKVQSLLFSVAVIDLFQRSIFQARKELISFQFFPSLTRLQVLSTLSSSPLNTKAALGKKFSCLGLQISVVIVDDIVQAI